MFRLTGHRLMSQSAPSERLAAVSRQFSSSNMARKRLANPALFICDIQEKFRPAIYEYGHVITTAAKMVKAATILDMPIYVTTQNAARLGATVKELSDLLPKSLPDPVSDPATASTLSTTSPPVLQHDKTAFSMITPAVAEALTKQSTPGTSGPQVPIQVLLVGIETHICVTQTALDLISMGHKVYILKDGVSSCNKGEREVAVERLRREGAVVTTSESVLFELMGDAKSEVFKPISGLVKETKEGTKGAVEILC